MLSIINCRYTYLKRIVEVFISIIISGLKYFYSPENNQWLFSEHNGSGYSGYAKLLFEFIQNNENDICPVWITRSSDIYKSLKKKKLPVVSYYSRKGIRQILKAKVYLITHSSNDIGKIVRKDRIIVNLWHGILVKPHINIYQKIRKKSRGTLKYKKDNFIRHIRFGKSFKDYDLVIAPSEMVKEKMEEQFPEAKNCAVTGVPTDIFFYHLNNKEEILRKYNLQKLDNKIIVSYLPTFRDNPKDDKLLFENNPRIEQLEGIVILLKYHPNCRSFKSRLNNLPSNVIYFNSNEIKEFELYQITDVLVTDYSSSYINFLPFNKPIIFYVYDFEFYMKSRGFLYNYMDVTPGPKIKTENELIRELKKFNDRDDSYIAKRQNVKNMYYKFWDGRSPERIYQEIMRLLS